MVLGTMVLGRLGRGAGSSQAVTLCPVKLVVKIPPVKKANCKLSWPLSFQTFCFSHPLLLIHHAGDQHSLRFSTPSPLGCGQLHNPTHWFPNIPLKSCSLKVQFQVHFFCLSACRFYPFSLQLCVCVCGTHFHATMSLWRSDVGPYCLYFFKGSFFCLFVCGCVIACDFPELLLTLPHLDAGTLGLQIGATDLGFI